MTDYGDCYSSTGSKCASGPMPGTIALRNAVLSLYAVLGSLGIYNCRPVRGGGSLSTHGEGRGWDCKCSAFVPAQKKAGDELADLLVKHYRKLGIQRIIWNRRQWDVKTKKWRSYGGTSPHTDHLHIELCWLAAVGSKKLAEDYVRMVLTEEEDLSPEQEQLLKDVLVEVKALRASVGDPYESGLTVQKALIKRTGRNPNDPKDWVHVEHLNVIEDRLDAIEAKLDNLTLTSEPTPDSDG